MVPGDEQLRDVPGRRRHKTQLFKCLSRRLSIRDLVLHVMKTLTVVGRERVDCPGSRREPTRSFGKNGPIAEVPAAAVAASGAASAANVTGIAGDADAGGCTASASESGP